jgi:hypothetical protein
MSPVARLDDEHQCQPFAVLADSGDAGDQIA